MPDNGIQLVKPSQIWHYEAIKILWKNIEPTLYYCANLHAKLYILECDGFRYAILGSANLTNRADQTNKELAVEFRTTIQAQDDDVAVAVTRLTE